MTKKEAKAYLTIGNHKLGATIASFSLPASKEVCGRVCEGCYAIKAQVQYKSVLPSREHKLQLSKDEDFMYYMILSIQTLKPKYVRIHDSGEFYSQEYINKWSIIVTHNPDVIFYCYTKRLNDFNFSYLMKHPNCIVIDSLSNGRINYGTIDKKHPDMFLCPDHKGSKERDDIPNGPLCGVTCTYCMTKQAEDTGVFFIKH